ncbi:ATP-dependent zinc metalloprotease FtsH [Caulobacter sp. KR2-114]|uniref:ATP-dependent zinc metalloprotease FtsH n=1 Tax=Caulobacter sp. KR2-114 TaxID=3400912 RepID=UPI003C1048C4
MPDRTPAGRTPTDPKPPQRASGDKGGPDPGHGHLTVGYVIAVALVLILAQWLVAYVGQTQTMPYSQFLTLVGQGKVAEVTVSQNTIEGRLKDGKTGFVSDRVDPELAQALAAKGVVVKGQASGGLLATLLSWVGPIFLFYLVWMFLARRMGALGMGGLNAVGHANAKIYAETDTKVTFADVAGVDEAKFELQEVVAFLKDPTTFGRLGARVPKGILLVGPPGTGKTLLARAVAGEAGVPFFSISGSAFVELFVGVGAARVRDLFDQARKAAPCIIFIDELDALGRSRSGAIAGGMDEKEQTLNQLLAELDGFDPRGGVILLAATNRPEILDPALLRAGRFDRQVLVDRPDHKGRLEILKVHARQISTAPDLELDQVAGLTTGFTGADLANLVNEAAIVATRRRGAAVTLADFTVAIERIIAGPEKKSRVLNAAERRRVAFHEMGHALVAASLPGGDPVQKVSIIPRGVGALGYTIQRPTEDRFLLARSDLESRIAVLLGGRAAEALIYDGDVSTGAADDLQRATEIAVEMVTRHGMDATVGERVYAPHPQAFLLAPEDRYVAAAEGTAREIDLAVRRIIDAAQVVAAGVLVRRRADLDAGAELLLTRETLTGDEFPALRALAPAPAPEHADA